MAGVAKNGAVREPLSRDRIFDTALALVDRTGLSGLTMRRLASELGVEAMSIYHHVKNKRDLLQGVVDRAFVGVDPPPATGQDWQAWVRAWMKLGRAVFERHPGLFPVLTSNAVLGARALTFIDALFGRLATAGFDEGALVNTWQVLKAYLLGTMVQERIVMDDESMADTLACCPNVAVLLPGLACCDLQAEFERGLELILAGMSQSRPAPADR